MHYELKIPTIHTGHSMLCITNVIRADTLEGAKSEAETILSSYHGCDYVLIIECAADGRYPVLTVTGEWEYLINPHTGSGYLKFVQHHYTDDPLTCFKHFGYAPEMA